MFKNGFLLLSIQGWYVYHVECQVVARALSNVDVQHGALRTICPSGYEAETGRTTPGV